MNWLSQQKIWDNYHFRIKESVITKSSITRAVDKFWTDQVTQLPEGSHLICLFRIKTIDNLIYTLGALVKLNKSDKKFLIQHVIDNLAIKSDDYKSIVVKEIIISYGFKKGAVDTLAHNVPLSETRQLKLPETAFQNYKHYKLPITMDPFQYGMMIHHDKSDNLFIVQISNSTQAKIKQTESSNYVEILREGRLVLSYEDKQLEDGKFTRTIGQRTYHYNSEGGLDLMVVNKKPTNRFIKSKPTSLSINNKFLTLDLETMLVDNVHTPFLISFYDGKSCYSSYLSDFSSPKDMITDCILKLCRDKYTQYKIYVHNLANFDAIFLLKVLAEIGELKVIMNDEHLVSFDFIYSKWGRKKGITLCFRDSYQIFLASLQKLALSTDVVNKKTIFPYTFVNQDNLDYVGPVPDKAQFDSITVDEYNNYKNSFDDKPWDLKTEAVKYCENDCVALYQVIEKYNELYFNKFNVNLHDHPTLPSSSFRLFRSVFMEHQIPMIYGSEYRNIKRSYTGGATDMYIPTNQPGELVYGYDVNSLYPFIMANYPMPLDKKTYFEGDIRKVDPNAFGFFYCNITVPSNLQHPILQTHVKTGSGLRTVAALGSYSDVVFSASMDNAMKLGYKFEILSGYTFDKDVIFKPFVDTLYQMRLDYPKSDPHNYMAKILLNSLYGKFGMKDEFDKIKVVTSKEFNSITNNTNNLISEVQGLGDRFLIKYRDLDDTSELKDTDRDYNINIAIASAITSYARNFMSQFKNHPGLKLFYTDTDSIYTNLNPDQMNELFPGIVSSTGLGKLKLESVSKKAYFLSPKCYGLESVDGQFTFKVKGLTKKVELTAQDFEALLTHGVVVQKTQEKWFKSLSTASITLLEQVYSIQQTENKRALIYDLNYKLIGTKPFTINQDKKIVKDTIL